MKMSNWLHPQSKMEGSKRSARNEQATEVQRNWDDWPAWERSEREKHTRKLGPQASSERGNITPDFRLDNVTRLQEQIDRAIQEHRYEDIPDLENAILAEQGHVQQQSDLTVKEKRWADAARFHDALTQHDRQGQMQTPNRLHQQIRMESLSSTTSGPALESADDTISAAQRMMEAAAAPAAAKKEKMEKVVADKKGKEDSPGFQLTQGPTLAISADTIWAAHKMLGAAVAPAAAKKDNVGNEVADNMCTGEISGHDYDAFDEMSNEADKLKAPFTDKDAMGGWKNVGQLPVWGDGAGGGDTWDPGSPIQGLSRNFARYFFPECTVVSSW